jgi:sterol 3beta-glucosyltransferase
MPRWLNRASFGFNRFSALAYGGMINTFRRDTLGLRRESRFSDYLTGPDGSPVPVLYAFSRHVVPVPADYPQHAHVTGYWFAPDDASWTPPVELEAFLARGEPSIYVGFGSMGFGKDAAARGRLILDALDCAGVRAVVATGWGGLSVSSSDRILVIERAPHAWLFPRVSAVVHHGGSGTTAAGLRAGRPTLICPFLGDQPFWGSRVNELGAGPKPLRLKGARADELAGRVSALVGDDEFSAAATHVAEGIRGDDGPGAAVGTLERILGQGSAPGQSRIG